MKKVGRLIMGQVICLAHGIHLAVVKVLYCRNYNCEDNNENVQCTSLEILDDSENYEDKDDFDYTADSSMPIIQNDTNEFYEEFEITNHEMLPLVEKVRAIVKIFRYSPTKNDLMLVKYV